MLSNRPYFPIVRAPEGESRPDVDKAEWSEGDDVEEGEYWDPPCRTCKKVDNEPNVLCDICNGAYHIKCLATLKGPPLPRSPEDDEWFCRACIRRGIPESIIDRVGRGSFAHYLVKWIGRATHEVSWENADALDTPWCRKLIRSYMESEKLRGRQGRSLLPPSHPLIDRLQRAKVSGGGGGGGGGGGSKTLLAGKHVLGPIACGADELLQLHEHCAALEQCDEGTRTEAKAAVSTAADALRGAHETLERALRPAMEAAKAAAIQAQASTQAQIDTERLATHKGTSYQGFLLYLREERPRIRAEVPAATSRAIEKAAATEWKDLEPMHKRQCVARAAELIVAADSSSKTLPAPAPTELQRMFDQVSGMCKGCGAAEGGKHVLGPIAETAKLLQLHEHCAALEQCDEGTRTEAKAAVSTAADALRGAHETLERALRPAMEAAKAASIQAQASVQAQMDAERLATHKGTAYQGFLLYLREERPRIRAELPAATSRAIEKAAATEWKDLEPMHKRQCVARAAELIVAQATQNGDGGDGCGDGGAADHTTLTDISNGRTPFSASSAAPSAASAAALAADQAGGDGGGGGGAESRLPPGWREEKHVTPSGRAYSNYIGPNGEKARSLAEVRSVARADDGGTMGTTAGGASNKEGGGGGGEANHRSGSRCRQPCDVCGTNDKRDFVECFECNARTHLMCFWPPWEQVAKTERWRCSKCACTPPPPLHEMAPAPGELIEVEVEVNRASGAVAWRPAVVLRLVPGSGRSKFLAKCKPASGGSDDDDLVDEYGVAGHGREWRRPQSTAEAAEAEREERGAAAAANAAVVAQLESSLAADAKPQPRSDQASLLPLVEELYRDGMVEAGCGISDEQVEVCYDAVSKGYESYMHAVKTLDLQEKLLSEGFMQIKMRHNGRYDLQLPELSTPDFSFLKEDAPWMPLVRASLGDDCVLTHFGCMLSFPGSTTQPWHSDGPHMPGPADAGNGEPFVAPLHAVNVFVPLVDLSTANGPTEFTPGTHVDFELRPESRTPLVKAGHALIFDYRTRHRGLGNSSGDERPLLYLTYARPFWLDVYNFDTKRYQQLPEVKLFSRAERMNKRSRDA